MSVLILAEEIDATADQVVRALGERGVDVHRVNTAWFPALLRLSARLRGDHWSGTLRTLARVIDLESVTAVWYRTPRAYQSRPSCRLRNARMRTWKPSSAWAACWHHCQHCG